MTIERLLEAGRALDAGQVEQAERLYQRVAEADPRSSIAIVGLARVASRRGDDAAARRLADAALAVDPGNVAAQRLLGEHNAASGPARSGPSVPAVSAIPAASAAAIPAGIPAAASEADSPAGEDDWPWPDLDEQLARYRRPEPRRVGRILKRG